MKKLFILFVLGVCAGAFGAFGADEITDENRAAVLKKALKKSYSVYYGLGRIRDVGLYTQKETSSDCRVLNARTGVVACSITDVNEDAGWVEGITVQWNVEHANSVAANYWFEKVEKIEH